MRAFEALLRNEVANIYREANRLQAAQSGDKDPERTNILAAQSNTLDEFSNVMAKEGQTDLGLNVEGSDPAQLIDDAAAASSAAVRSSRKKVQDQPALAAT